MREGGVEMAIPIGQINGEDIQGRWQKWVTAQDTLWVDKSGAVYRIADLDADYAFNIIHFLSGTHAKDLGDDMSENILVKALARRANSKYGPDDYRYYALPDLSHIA